MVAHYNRVYLRHGEETQIILLLLKLFFSKELQLTAPLPKESTREAQGITQALLSPTIRIDSNSLEFK
jgi:hypothetical protein